MIVSVFRNKKMCVFTKNVPHRRLSYSFSFEAVSIALFLLWYFLCILHQFVTMKLNFEYFQTAYDGVLTPSEHSFEVEQFLQSEVFSTDGPARGAFAAPDCAVKPSGWKHKRITRRDVLLVQYRKKIQMLRSQRMNRTSLFMPGFIVYSRNAKISDLSSKPVHVRKTRLKTIGTVVKESSYIPGFWLVYFFGVKKFFYCSHKVVTFLSNSNPPSKVTKSHCNKVSVSSVSVNTEDKEFIMTTILANKMFNLESGKDQSIRELAASHKVQYPWINAKILSQFLASFRRSVSDFASEDDLAINNVKAQIDSMKDDGLVDSDDMVEHHSSKYIEFNCIIPCLLKPKMCRLTFLNVAIMHCTNIFKTKAQNIMIETVDVNHPSNDIMSVGSVVHVSKGEIHLFMVMYF